MKIPNSELAYEAICSMIANKSISPGQQIVEGVLAAQLGISRTPVREAMRRLQEEGLVDIIANKGSYLKVISFSDMANSYEVIEAITCMSYKILAEYSRDKKLKKSDIDKLEVYAEKMRVYLEANEIQKWINADIEFHRRIVVLTENSFLLRTYTNMNQCINQVLWFITPAIVDKALSTKEHFEILENIKAGNVEKSILVGHTHITKVVEQIRQFV